MFFNHLKTALLLGALTGLLLFIGHILGGNHGVLIAFIFAAAINFMTYFYSDKLVLRMYGAKPLSQNKFEHVYEMVQDLCYDMKMPMPKLWYIPTSMANAFATGRNPKHASVAVTQGILDILDEYELRAVLAHEMAHVKNRDILIGTIAATLAAAIGYLATMMRWSLIFGGSRGRDRGNGLGALLVAIVMPIAALLIQLAISRSREYMADETGAYCCKDPLALASALEKLNSSVKIHKYQPQSTAQATTASLFIVYPFTSGGMMSLFSTHPPMNKRIERLHRIADKI